MDKQQSIQSGSGKQHAVVIGASMAGLLAARALSDHFEQVTIIERDQLTDDTEPRRGVPQGRHAHALLAGGASVLGELFPDLFPALARDGAVPLSISDIRWYTFGAWMKPVPTPVKTLVQSRPFLEQHVRDSLAVRSNVRFIDACEVTQLCAHDERITGVALRHRMASSARRFSLPTLLWTQADVVRARHNGSHLLAMATSKNPASKSMLATPRASIDVPPSFLPIGSY